MEQEEYCTACFLGRNFGQVFIVHQNPKNVKTFFPKKLRLPVLMLAHGSKFSLGFRLPLHQMFGSNWATD